MKLKLHSRIKFAVEFSDVGVVKPNGEFEVDDKRAEELIQLEYAEPVAASKKITSPKGKSKTSTVTPKTESSPSVSEPIKSENNVESSLKNSSEANDGVG